MKKHERAYKRISAKIPRVCLAASREIRAILKRAASRKSKLPPGIIGLAADNNKTAVLTLWLTEDEYGLFQTAATVAGMRLSTWIRHELMVEKINTWSQSR